LSALRSIVIGLALLLAATAARADEAREAQARSYFSIGQGHYALGEYAAAIEAFQAGYRMKPLPMFLFNIAQAARRSGRNDLAEEYYVQYLERETTRAPQKAEAESWLLKLRRDNEIARSRRPPPPKEPPVTRAAPPPPPPSPTPTPVAPTPPPARAPLVAAPTPAPELTAVPELTTSAPPAPAKRPIWKRGWFWGTLAAAAVVAAGVGVGTWLAVQPHGPAKPNLGSVDF